MYEYVGQFLHAAKMVIRRLPRPLHTLRPVTHATTDSHNRYEALAIGALALLTVLSALRYGAYFYPYLNSDMAMHVLMARDFDFDYSLWYWGQTRLGSLLPYLASFLWDLGLNPLKSITVVQYAMVSCCVVLFGLIVRNVWATLLFALLFLFPSPADVYLIVPGHPYLPHLMLTLAGIFALQWSDGRKPLIDSLLILVFWAIGFVAVWVSDMALITVPIILAWKISGDFGLNLRKWVGSFSGWTLALGPVALYAWAKTLKRQAIDWSGYTGSGFADMHQFKQGLDSASARWESSYLTFDSVLTHWSARSALIICTIGAIIMFRSLVFNRLQESRIRGFRAIPHLFFVLGVALICVSFSSAWAAKSGFDERYFSLPVLLFEASLISFLGFPQQKWKQVGVAFMVLLTTMFNVLAYAEHWTDGSQLRVDDESRGRLKMMTHSTIIGDYWFCYAMAAYNCNEVIPLAFDDQFYRNSHQVDAAFISDSIFVCTDPKHPVLPDTLMQQGRTLIRTQEPAFPVGNSNLGRYVVIHQPDTKKPRP